MFINNIRKRVWRARLEAECYQAAGGARMRTRSGISSAGSALLVNY